MKYNYDDTFLARWVNNDLTQDELSEFKKSEDYDLYKKIIEKSSELSVQNFDQDKLLHKVKAKLATNNQAKSKVVNLRKRIMYAVAASVAVLLGVFYFLNTGDTNYSTGFGEQMAVLLPDNSELTLNSKSTVSFNKKNWKNDRKVQLKGEGYFKVEKGQTFTVNTKQGEVKVLGTQFNVVNNASYFEVTCYEGKVNVTTSKDDIILTKGMGYRLMNSSKSEQWNFDFSRSNSWMTGESSFESTPLSEVIKSIENQYDIQVKNTGKIDLTQRFTGSFTHNNLQVALKTVFVPMKIDITFTNEKTISLVK